jgi:hypothetical protein
VPVNGSGFVGVEVLAVVTVKIPVLRDKILLALCYMMAFLLGLS